MSPCKPGDRICLLGMPDDPDPLPVGSTGTVTRVTTGPMAQITIKWDCGRSLMLIPEVDQYEVLPSPIKIPAEVLRGIEAVRVSGATNMLDRPTVASIAEEFGFEEAAIWLRDAANRPRYAQGIFRGFAADDEEPKVAP